jgi:ATP-dependent exoDNAse (exonuclease V) beta subunit
MKPYRTEWMIYDEDIKISGSIDMVYENDDGTLSIYDWKRCKQITKVNQYNKFAITKEICDMPDSNFWHYSLQLNTYKAILEAKYNKRIRDMFLVQLHPEADEGNYALYPVPDLSITVTELLSKLKQPQQIM